MLSRYSSTAAMQQALRRSRVLNDTRIGMSIAAVLSAFRSTLQVPITVREFTWLENSTNLLSGHCQADETDGRKGLRRQPLLRVRLAGFRKRSGARRRDISRCSNSQDGVRLRLSGSPRTAADARSSGVRKTEGHRANSFEMAVLIRLVARRNRHPRSAAWTLRKQVRASRFVALFGRKSLPLEKVLHLIRVLFTVEELPLIDAVVANELVSCRPYPVVRERNAGL